MNGLLKRLLKHLIKQKSCTLFALPFLVRTDVEAVYYTLYYIQCIIYSTVYTCITCENPLENLFEASYAWHIEGGSSYYFCIKRSNPFELRN